jgi:segregation and condensation protein B
VIGTLLERKLITTAGRKQVIGRPILYKTTREFLLRFGLGDLSELPSMEEFEKLVGDLAQQEFDQISSSPTAETGVDEPGRSEEISSPGADHEDATEPVETHS